MISLILAAAMVAQSPKVIVTQPDESKFPDITVYFEVRNADGSFIRDAKREEFRVEEDGKEQKIVAFDSPVTVLTKPTTIVLVLDQSGSMNDGGKLEGLKEAVGVFLEGLPDGSRVAVIAFSSRIRVICPFTTDRTRIRRSVQSLEADGSTRYFDAVQEALKLLERETGRRAVLAMTDGQDTDSRLPIEAVILNAQRLGLPVHTLGLGEGETIDAEPLETLAQQTRGRFYRAKDADALKAIYQELADRLGSSYSLVYQTDRKVADGTLRPIKVYYSESQGAGETAVFIRGMVVREAGWSRLFLVLIGGLGGLAIVPSLWNRRESAKKSE